MNWENLSSIEQAKELIASSVSKPVVFFKHSTRCSISSSSLARVERQWKSDLDSKFRFVFLDLIKHRDVSNFLAEKLNVEHQSPQMILVKNNQAVFDSSHNAITLTDLEEQLA
ncbi:MAG: bacillithiol system redox-active protein YtxJ [Cytophagales bacterium]